ncbi:TOPRIM nucleotidyl transferase/hydrolase domain-containing protein, partial [Staphylococcus sp. SIMBA_130]
ITNKLNLKNVVWVSNGQAFSLSTLENTTAKYFQKLDNVNILKFILSEKVIIVEGASEYILMPLLYYKTHSSSLEEDGVEVISGEGLT